MPGRDQRNPKAMSDPKTKDPHISWPRYVHQVRLKWAKLSYHPIPISAQQRIAIEVVVHRESSRASLQLQRGERLLLDCPRSCAAVNAEKGKLLALGKRGEFPAQRGDAIRLME